MHAGKGVLVSKSQCMSSACQATARRPSAPLFARVFAPLPRGALEIFSHTHMQSKTEMKIGAVFASVSRAFPKPARVLRKNQLFSSSAAGPDTQVVSLARPERRPGPPLQGLSMAPRAPGPPRAPSYRGRPGE